MLPNPSREARASSKKEESLSSRIQLLELELEQRDVPRRPQLQDLSSRERMTTATMTTTTTTTTTTELLV